MAARRRTFPLVARRMLGTHFGRQPTSRRGRGADVAGSRPYVPGDPVAAIDWAASARLSSARGSDEFVVRERYAEEAPRVVLVRDRRPSMALFPPGLPWLDKPRAVQSAAGAIVASAAEARSDVGYLDHAGAEPDWLPPRRRPSLELLAERVAAGPYAAAPSSLGRALDFLLRRSGDVPAGSFVFVLSDFLGDPPLRVLPPAALRRWVLVPVVVQDRLWEQSFPAVGGVSVPVVEPGGWRIRDVRLGRGEARERALAHAERFRRLLEDFRGAGLLPVVVDSADDDAVDDAFLAWAEERSLARRRVA